MLKPVDKVISPTRSALELLDLEMSFGQQMLPSSSQFERECKRRGINLWPAKLQSLRRAGLLTPLYRFEPEMHRAPSRIQRTRPYRVSAYIASELSGLGMARETYYIYSMYQLLLLPTLRNTVDRMAIRRSDSGTFSARVRMSSERRSQFAQVVKDNDQLVVVLSVLETIYRPEIVNRITLRRIPTYERWAELRSEFDPAETLAWLGCDHEWIRHTAETLLLTADHLDPYSEWRDLVRLVRPSKWDKLHGDALMAMDRLIAAEMLLLFYEDLVREGAAPELEPIPRYAPHSRHSRLGADKSNLDSVLMDFGLSPEPSLVMVIEGETESLIVPRVMDLLGIPRRRSFIDLVEARGIERDFGFLAAYVAKPHLGEVVQDYVVLDRPVTRILIVVDAEGKKFFSSSQRDKFRKRWAGEIFARLPQEYKTPAMRIELDKLVKIETWGTETFEFAHFSDDELARAILKVYRGIARVQLTDLPQVINNIRRKSGNLDTVWKRWPKPHPSKIQIAEELWPSLANRIQDAVEREDFDSIPMLRVVGSAYQLATEFFRHDVVLPHVPAVDS